VQGKVHHRADGSFQVGKGAQGAGQGFAAVGQYDAQRLDALGPVGLDQPLSAKGFKLALGCLAAASSGASDRQGTPPAG
jgi:hypothetical protein